MLIEEIRIEGIGGIKNLKLDFHEGLNLICGTNGVGKTTILDCIANIFISNRPYVKRNVNSMIGKLYCRISIGPDSIKEVSYSVTEFLPENNKDYISNYYNLSKDILYFKAYRDINYRKIQSISRDPDKDDNSNSHDAITGINANDIKDWLVQRFLWSAHEGVLTEERLYNFEKAKKCFSSLDSAVSFSKIIPETYDIMVNTNQGEVYFEYLSSGYKSCVYILLGIIKEIEYRYKDNKMKCDDFNGIILIDEIDIHLHPQWQASLIKALKSLVPKTQIIATTHSPSMVQSAEANEIISLALDEYQNVVQKHIKAGKYGFKGWTIEEILTDVMGMENTKSDLYEKTIREFDKAMDSEDYKKAKECYVVLNEMLHTNNPIRKLLQIQMAGIGE